MDRDLAQIQLKSKDMIMGLVLTLLLGGFGLFYIGVLWGLFGSFIMVILLSGVFYETTLQLIPNLPLYIISYVPPAIISNILELVKLLYPVRYFIIPFFYALFLVITMVSINGHNKRLLTRAMNRK